MSPVPDVPIEEVACQIAIGETDGLGDCSLRPETKAAIVLQGIDQYIRWSHRCPPR